ncbi:MAG TPA: DUF1326 domain-containing protein [Planctomycetaceae bacterium]|nr:DUF1326 domain-containing protein [Planctomycetaceae bacterium]
MPRFAVLMVGLVVVSGAGLVQSAEISGEYLEARTCDVYTGPCFANGEIGIAGKEAVMAWKVDEGTWAGQDLAGLGVALIVKANDTLGFGGSFTVKPDRITAVIVVDEKANPEQALALVRFVKENARHLTSDVVKVEKAPITLTNNHLSGKGVFSAGRLAKIETRKMAKGDCVCSNETVFYPPLTKVDNAHPAYTLDMTFAGTGLNSTWTTINKRSAFMATFER